MVKRALRQLVDHPRGRLIVIIVSFAVGLVAIIPLADEYSDLTGRRDQLQTALAEARLAEENIERFEARVNTQVQQLTELESHTIPAEQVLVFRSQIVQLVRESGCRIRRIDTGSPHSRPWLAEDRPLALRGDPQHKETGYDLTRQNFSLSVTGSLPKIKSFLVELHRRGDFVHTNKCSLKPVGAKRDEVILELELWLFDLTRKSSISA